MMAGSAVSERMRVRERPTPCVLALPVYHFCDELDL